MDVERSESSLKSSANNFAFPRNGMAPDEVHLYWFSLVPRAPDLPIRERSRHILRQLLGHYLGRSAADLEFETGPEGKPSLASKGLQFNLSHSKDQLVIALTAEAAVGVDVEVVREGLSFEKMARRFFSKQDQFLLSRSHPEPAKLFFTRWTLMEAEQKLKGRSLWGARSRRSNSEFYLGNIPAPEGYIAALAVNLLNPRLSTFGFSSSALNQ